MNEEKYAAEIHAIGAVSAAAGSGNQLVLVSVDIVLMDNE